MLSKPIHPIVRVNVAKILMDVYGLSGGEAVALATLLIKRLRARGLDIVVGNWMEDEKRGAFDWNDLSSLADELSERKPWNPPELN